MPTSIIMSILYMNGDDAGNTVEKNFTVFSLIQMHYLLSARACGQ